MERKEEESWLTQLINFWVTHKKLLKKLIGKTIEIVVAFRLHGNGIK